MDQQERAKIRIRGFIKAAVTASIIDGIPRIGILNKVLNEVLGNMGFRITPPTYVYPRKEEKEK